MLLELSNLRSLSGRLLVEAHVVHLSGVLLKNRTTGNTAAVCLMWLSVRVSDQTIMFLVGGT